MKLRKIIVNTVPDKFKITYLRNISQRERNHETKADFLWCIE